MDAEKLLVLPGSWCDEDITLTVTKLIAVLIRIEEIWEENERQAKPLGMDVGAYLIMKRDGDDV